MERLTPKQIADALQLLPSEIGRQAEVVEDARQNLDIKKHELSVLEAQKYLIFEAAAEKQTATRINARVKADPDIDKKEAEVITAEGNYRVAGIKLEELENKFIAARKIASLREVELKAMPE